MNQLSMYANTKQWTNAENAAFVLKVSFAASLYLTEKVCRLAYCLLTSPYWTLTGAYHLTGRICRAVQTTYYRFLPDKDADECLKLVQKMQQAVIEQMQSESQHHHIGRVRSERAGIIEPQRPPPFLQQPDDSEPSSDEKDVFQYQKRSQLSNKAAAKSAKSELDEESKKKLAMLNELLGKCDQTYLFYSHISIDDSSTEDSESEEDVQNVSSDPLCTAIRLEKQKHESFEILAELRHILSKWRNNAAELKTIPLKEIEACDQILEEQWKGIEKMIASRKENSKQQPTEPKQSQTALKRAEKEGLFQEKQGVSDVARPDYRYNPPTKKRFKNLKEVMNAWHIHIGK
jgi:hypothetical protein